MRLRLMIASAVVFPMITIGFLIVDRRANESWDRMAAWADATEEQWRSRDFHRQALWGESAAGASFVCYEQAIAAASEVGAEARGRLPVWREHQQDATPAEWAEFDRSWSEPIRLMQEGARLDDARLPIEWKDGMEHRTLARLPARDLVNAALVQARRLADGGEAAAAARLVLDAGLFAVDLQQSPILVDQMLASALVAIVAKEGLLDARLAALPDEQLRLLAAGMAAIEERCRKVFDGSGEALLLARSLMRGVVVVGTEEEREDTAGRATSWRHGWSKRWAAADGVLSLVDATVLLDQATGLPWAERSAALERTASKLRAAQAPLARAWAPILPAAERTLRTTLCHVRLCRLALLDRLGVAAPELEDPLGAGALAVVTQGGQRAFRSEGAGTAIVRPALR
jgi:hypothetical protein